MSFRDVDTKTLHVSCMQYTSLECKCWCTNLLFPEVIATADVYAAFKDIDVAVLVGAMPRREGMERKDLLKANVKIFKQQGEALDKVAKKSVKVIWFERH